MLVPLYPPAHSLSSAASHIFSQFMNDQGSGPRVMVSTESSLRFGDEKRSKSNKMHFKPL